MATSDVLLDELSDKIDEINKLSEKLHKMGVKVGFKQKPIVQEDNSVINTIEFVHWVNYVTMEDKSNV